MSGNKRSAVYGVGRLALPFKAYTRVIGSAEEAGTAEFVKPEQAVFSLISVSSGRSIYLKARFAQQDLFTFGGLVTFWREVLNGLGFTEVEGAAAHTTFVGEKTDNSAFNPLNIKDVIPYLNLATGLAQSVKAFACRSEVALGRGFDPAWADYLVGFFPRFSPTVRRMPGTKESVLRAVIHLGFSASEADRRFNVSERTARRWVQNYQRSAIFGRKSGSGRRKIFTPQQDARLVAEVERNPFHTAATLKAVVNFPGHDQTVRNRLRAANLRSRCAIPREVHKEGHIEEHLVFAVGNGDRDWKRVIFSDEVTFSTTRKDPLLYIVLLVPDWTTDTLSCVPAVVEYLCRVGGGSLDSWDAVAENSLYLETVVYSMPTRLQDVIEMGGR
ncbi:hypothetical protein ANN_26783 [Periplaneta americana]|uniref:Transposase n=1 Tax=Periplaneta americana TaxID=6978 RepID=A0ABQ8RZ30_PERAM|nr:hypothetical protein ANN_26783 [Periplaneta americana]